MNFHPVQRRNFHRAVIVVVLLSVFLATLAGVYSYAKLHIHLRHTFIKDQIAKGAPEEYFATETVRKPEVDATAPLLLRLLGEKGYGHVAVIIPDDGREEIWVIPDTHREYVRAKQLFPEAAVHAFEISEEEWLGERIESAGVVSVRNEARGEQGTPHPPRRNQRTY